MILQVEVIPYYILMFIKQDTNIKMHHQII